MHGVKDTAELDPIVTRNHTKKLFQWVIEVVKNLVTLYFNTATVLYFGQANLHYGFPLDRNFFIIHSY